MKKIALLALACTGLAAAALPAFADDDRRPDRRGGDWMSVGALAAKLEAQGYTAIRDIERDDGRYEVEARSPEGHRVDLKISRGGEILRSERDDDDDWDD